MTRVPVRLLLLALLIGACSHPPVAGTSAPEEREPQQIDLDGVGRSRLGADALWIVERSGLEESRASDRSSDFFLGRGLIQQAERRDEPTRDPFSPGTGHLVTHLEERTVVVPLEHTSVEGEIRDHVATLAVTQHFANPFDHPIEAVYVFPLPHDAAVTDFLMTIGDRTIRGVIREREEARRLYEEAKRQGVAASLLTQERPNVFTQRVANIAPGHGIDVTIEYLDRLAYRDGWYELVFPMVVGPRYDPRGTTDGIGAVTLATRGSSGQVVEVPYLRPEERSGHEIDVSIDLDAGVPIEELACDSHRLDVERPAPERAQVRLAQDDRVPNRDLVLGYRLAADDVRTAGAVHLNDDGGWLHLTVLPPAELGDLPARPIELICVVDTSGSMSGAPLSQAREALREALRRLTPRDTFRLIRFSNGAGELDGDPLPATPENLRLGQRWVADLKAGGGTEMMTGIRACLRHPKDPERNRLVVFLTDGYIGNEEEILTEVRRSVGDARLFSFGVGSSTNRFLLEAMAREGRGAAAFLALDQDAAPVLARTFERLRRPALTELELDWGGLPVAEVYPSELPDLLIGRPIEVVARVTEPRDPASVAVRLLGHADGAVRAVPVPLRRVAPGRPARALAKLWARAKIADLHSQARGPDAGPRDDYLRRVTAVALEHGLMSATTAFVAVDSLTRVDGESKTVPVAVPVPEGVDFDTTVRDG